MEIPGRVQNGVVVLEGAPVLPEGAHVTVSYNGSTPRLTWDDIFATRLSVRPGDPAAEPEIGELSGDDLLL